MLKSVSNYCSSSSKLYVGLGIGKKQLFNLTDPRLSFRQSVPDPLSRPR